MAVELRGMKTSSEHPGSSFSGYPVLALIALAVLIAAGLLAAYALRSQASYFYLPEQMRDDPPEIGQAVRLGGMVQEGCTWESPASDEMTSRLALKRGDFWPTLNCEGFTFAL